MPTIFKRTIPFLLTLFALGEAVTAQTYPSRAITIVVPLAPGGAVDSLARILAEHMKSSLGQPVLVENVSGGGGNIAVGRVARAAPDGHIVSMGTGTQFVVNAAIYPLPYDVVNDFEPVALLPSVPYWIIARQDHPAPDLSGLVAWLKSAPDKVSAGTTGPGGGAHLCASIFQAQTGTKFQLVPYRGGAPAIQDLIGGQINLMCDLAANSLSQFRGGALKVFAVTAPTRWFAAPEVPTVDEAGAPGLHVSAWQGFWVPKGTPKDTVYKLNAAVRAALTEPAVRQRITDLGMDIPPPQRWKPEDLAIHQKAEIDKLWPILKAANIKAE
jgi:tripartite-type tricarboxylate transporter receptor subunit TctC